MTSPPALHDPQVWCNLVDAVEPASILLAISWRMGNLRQHVTPEDIWQETLLRGWQARSAFQWQGAASFRRWLLVIAEHCIESQRVHIHAQKRGTDRTLTMASHGGSGDSHAKGVVHFEPWGSTTPSRIATERERAAGLQQALESLPEELREVVRLRLIEDLPILAIAAQLGLGESGVRHRFRKGAELLHTRLKALLDGSVVSAAAPKRDARARESG